MLTEVRILLAILAVYRVSELFSLDDGPYKIFDRLRKWAGRSSYKSETHRTFADLLHCPFCTGVWFSFLVLPLLLLPTVPGDIFILGCGIAGAQTFLETMSNKRR